jgi:hypothetical protein
VTNFLKDFYSKVILVLITASFLLSCTSTRKVSTSNSNLMTSFEVITDLDLEITETSGLETFQGKLLTHNDSDATPTIYLLDTTGQIQRSTTFSKMQNVDWEDIAIGNSSLFIADIGNNYGDRRDLTIYKIPLDSIENRQVSPGKIEISYNNQKRFERDNQHHSFDGEAIVYLDGELLLFSKDWINFTTDVYRIQEKTGTQSLTSKQQLKVNGLITGATTNGKDRIVLCGYNSGLEPFVAVISNNNGDLELMQRIALPIKNGAQVEGITYFIAENDEEIYYLSSEAVNIKLGEDEAKTNGQLYKLRLKN